MNNWARKSGLKKYLAPASALVWVATTISLCIWWFYFSYSQVNRLERLGVSPSNEALKHHKMLMWEGATLVVSLLLGAAALLYFIIKERRARAELETFLSAFTHELKTPLSSIQLQAELLQKKLAQAENKSILERLQSEVQRLTAQLENSLYLVGTDAKRFYIEKIDLAELLLRVIGRFPALELDLELSSGPHLVESDARALEMVLSNIAINAIVHGSANRLSVSVEQEATRTVLRIADNGKGYAEQANFLGKAFSRVYSGSGSGVGLYVSRAVLRALGGDLIFKDPARGFMLEITLPRKGIRSE
ncbi:HAMP domain-containing histidine kinase [bacterium]|nr:HAMP domain-containing histidine kinase [bacterium]